MFKFSERDWNAIGNTTVGGLVILIIVFLTSVVVNTWGLQGRMDAQFAAAAEKTDAQFAAAAEKTDAQFAVIQGQLATVQERIMDLRDDFKESQEKSDAKFEEARKDSDMKFRQLLEQVLDSKTRIEHLEDDSRSSQ